MQYNYGKPTGLDFDESVAKVKAELKNEGFGVLTEIDAKQTLKDKLGVDFDKYLILGACNPPFSHKALLAEKPIGLLLPCNVIVYEEGGKTAVAAILPTAAMSVVDNPEIAEIAEQAEAKLKSAIDKV